jgi:hypothetical protein
VTNRKKPPTKGKRIAEPAPAYALRRWRKGMRLMNRITAEEARALTEQDKSRDIEELFDSGFGMRWPNRTKQQTEVTKRWNRLREKLGARS